MALKNHADREHLENIATMSDIWKNAKRFWPNKKYIAKLTKTKYANGDASETLNVYMEYHIIENYE